MNDPYDLIFDPTALSAQVIFVGTRCGRDNLLRNYRTGVIHFVRAGEAQVLCVGAAPVPINEPSLVFFPQAHAHWVQGADDGGCELVCAITSFGDTFNDCVADSLPAVIVMPLTQLSPIRHTLEAFFSEAASSAPGSRQLADKLCEVVLGYLIRHVVQQESPGAGLLAATRDACIGRAIRAIHTRFMEALDLDTLAHCAGMSRTRFVERFTALVGTSPHCYLVNYRISVAQRLLADRMPVKTVADRVGYATASAFVRKFKEVVGMSPGAWSR